MKPLFVSFRTPGGYYIYDGNRNSILKFEKEEFETLLQDLRAGAYETSNIVKKYQKKGFLLPGNIKKIKHPETDFLEFRIRNCMEKVTLQLTQNCNMRCDYCAYSGSYYNRTHNNKRMSLDTAKKAIDFLQSHSKDRKSVNVAFYGGEPLLEKELLKESVAYAKKRLSHKKLSFTVTTNGTLLDDDIIEFFIENNFWVMISLDGPKEIHDANRKLINGNGSFDLIMKNVKHVQEKYPEYFKNIHFNVVLNPGDSLKCTSDFFNAQDVIASEYVNKSLLADNYAKDSKKYDESYFIDSSYERFKLFLYLLKKINKRNVSKLFIQDFSKIKQCFDYLVPIHQLPETYHPGGPCIPGVRRGFVTVDGKILPCERVSEESDMMVIGHIESGIDIEKANRILNIGEISKDECIQCWCFLHCTMCAAMADDTYYFSKEKKLNKCLSVKNSVIETMKDVCFLLEQGFDMERGFSMDNYNYSLDIS